MSAVKAAAMANSSGAGSGNGNAACAPGKVMCGTQCVNLSINLRNCGACGQACQAGQTCSAGVCSGAANGTRAGNANVNGKNNGARKNSGAGNVNATCAPGKTMCGGQCVNFSINPKNCGACGHACQTGQKCVVGQCSR